MIETAESLRKWGISVNEHIRTATHVIVHGEITGDDPNLIGVSRGLQFVTPSYLTTLSSTLEEFSKPTDLKQGFVMPVAETPHPRFEDERREASWWNPQPERASVWNGKVIVFLIAKNVSRDLQILWLLLTSPAHQESVAARRYVGFSGAETELIDITSRPILSPHDLMKKLAPIQQKAREVAQAANMPEDDALIVAITDGALHRYNGVDIPVDSNILTQSLTDAKIPFGSSLHWWRALTRCQWRDFVADDEEEGGSSELSLGVRLMHFGRDVASSSRHGDIGRGGSIPDVHSFNPSRGSKRCRDAAARRSSEGQEGECLAVHGSLKLTVRHSL